MGNYTKFTERSGVAAGLAVVLSDSLVQLYLNDMCTAAEAAAVVTS